MPAPLSLTCTACGTSQAFPFTGGLSPALVSYEAGWRCEPAPLCRGCVPVRNVPPHPDAPAIPQPVVSAPEEAPVAVYADGGVIRVNPSPLGGTWAWCWVDAAGQRTRTASGLIRPADVGAETVSNNVAEFMALARALRSLPDGWSGTVYSDSRVTIGRIFEAWRDAGLPYGWVQAAQDNLARLGRVKAVLLDGHPTKAQLAAGIGKRGNPVSEHNVFCDRECQRVAAEVAP